MNRSTILRRHEIAGPVGSMFLMPSFDLFSIGHSNIPAERFAAMLQDAAVTAVADVRSVPNSRWFPWFSQKALAAQLAGIGIAYTGMGDTLGGRPRDGGLYRDGVADYEAMAREREFQTALDRLQGAVAHSRICLMCAEREPLDCHRCLLVARHLAARGLAIGHILHDGTIESHAATEQRLLALEGEDSGLFAAGQDDRLAAAYRHRAHAVAFRQKVPTRRAGVEQR
jgi:uncharacterized protein (DUF488 family)